MRSKGGSWGGRAVGAVRLVHPYPVAVVVMTSLLILLIAERGLPPLGVGLRVGGTVLASQVAIGALNDYLDRHDDAVMQPDKPIPSGLVSPSVALFEVTLALLALTLLAGSFGASSLMLMWLATSGGIAYDLGLKRTRWAFVGYLIGFLTLVTWLWSVSGRLSPSFAALYPAGAMLVIAAHLANALPDIETDRRLGHQGLAILLGAARTWRLALGLCAAAGVQAALLAILARSILATSVVASGLALVALSACAARRTGLRPSSRKPLFRLVAAAVGLLALGCLLAASRLE